MTTGQKIGLGLVAIFFVFWLQRAAVILVLVFRHLRKESRLPAEQRKKPRAVVLYEKLHPALKVLLWFVVILTSCLATF